MKILIINGPNLNMLGRREPGIYGSQSWDDYYPILKSSLPAGVETEYFQSNHEGDIIDKIQQTDADGIALNAGAYTHTSLAIADAISAVKKPVVEVHISNVAARKEEIRHRSLIGPVCKGSIAGFGLDSYRLAAEALTHLLQSE